MPLIIRPMLPVDLDAVLRVQAACYPPAMQEPGEIVLQRMTAARGTCLVGDDAGVCGYLFAWPSRLGQITDLGAPCAITPAADTLYLHDLAVDPRALGRGLARSLVEACLALGRKNALAQSALVSVQDSARFWHALGYRAEAADAPELSGYPPGAAYMVRTPL